MSNSKNIEHGLMPLYFIQQTLRWWLKQDMYNNNNEHTFTLKLNLKTDIQAYLGLEKTLVANVHDSRLIKAEA
jgi:hypothetical protein